MPDLAAPYVFLSYSSADRPRALAIAGRLEQAGVGVWIDRQGIEGGQSYGPEIVDGISHCAAFVLLCSVSSLASRNCVQEIRLAWSENKPYVPLLLETVTFPDQIRYWLEGWQWVEVLEHPETEWLPRLLRALTRLGIPAKSDVADARAAVGIAEVATGTATSSPEPQVRAVPLPASNLSPGLTSFVGRSQELDAVRGLVAGSRLVTLTGAGGSGKTRLAVETGRDLVGRFADGVWMVELAALTDAEHLPSAVAAALSVRETPGQPLIRSIVDALRRKHLLLALDNCEHLLDACAHFVGALVHACPAVQVLTTSRAPLGVPGEAIYRVPALSVPQTVPDGEAGVQVALGFDAVRLFVDRALAAQPRFAITAANAGVIAEICRRLDGIPLALELAAARVKVLTPEQIAARLADRFHLLTGGARTALPRQQTLRAAIDWSYDLLTPAEQDLLQRLSVFSGGWVMEAAEVVCAGELAGATGPVGIDEFEVLDLLTELVDKSLVSVVSNDDQAARYRMLETIREYASEKLSTGRDPEPLRDRHRDWFFALIDEAERYMEGPEQRPWLDRLDAEHDNVRTAIDQSLSRDGAGALQAVCALWRFSQVRGYIAEARRWFGLALAVSDGAPAPLRARSLNRAGVLARVQGDFARATELLEVSLELYRQLDDTWGVAGALGNLGNVVREQGNLDRAQALHEECLRLCRQTGDRLRTANALGNVGVVAFNRGDFGQAESFMHEALSLSRELGDESRVARALVNLGDLMREQGEYARAAMYCAEALPLSEKVGERQLTAEIQYTLGSVVRELGELARSRALLTESLGRMHALGARREVARCLRELAGTALAEGQDVEAVGLLGAELALRTAVAFDLSPRDQVRFDGYLALARVRLGDAQFAVTWSSGQSEPLDLVLGRMAAAARVSLPG